MDTVKKESITSDMNKNLVHRYGGDNATILDMQFVLIFILDIRIEELLQIKLKHVQIKVSIFFFYVDFLSGTFTNHRTAGKGEGYFINFHPLHRHLDIGRAITAESSPLHIASSRTRTGNLWFPSASR